MPRMGRGIMLEAWAKEELMHKKQKSITTVLVMEGQQVGHSTQVQAPVKKAVSPYKFEHDLIFEGITLAERSENGRLLLEA
ncbi:hypothetical protein Ancab_029046 [Ancistrocladus abbreviatus]